MLNLLMVAGSVLTLRRVRASRAGSRLVILLGSLAVVRKILYEAGMPSVGLVTALMQSFFYAAAAVLMCVYMLSDTRAPSSPRTRCSPAV